MGLALTGRAIWIPLGLSLAAWPMAAGPLALGLRAMWWVVSAYPRAVTEPTPNLYGVGWQGEVQRVLWSHFALSAFGEYVPLSHAQTALVNAPDLGWAAGGIALTLQPHPRLGVRVGGRYLKLHARGVRGSLVEVISGRGWLAGLGFEIGVGKLKPGHVSYGLGLDADFGTIEKSSALAGTEDSSQPAAVVLRMDAVGASLWLRQPV